VVQDGQRWTARPKREGSGKTGKLVEVLVVAFAVARNDHVLWKLRNIGVAAVRPKCSDDLIEICTYYDVCVEVPHAPSFASVQRAWPQPQPLYAAGPRLQQSTSLATTSSGTIRRSCHFAGLASGDPSTDCSPDTEKAIVWTPTGPEGRKTTVVLLTKPVIFLLLSVPHHQFPGQTKILAWTLTRKKALGFPMFGIVMAMR
jgi:hypothetical protein